MGILIGVIIGGIVLYKIAKYVSAPRYQCHCGDILKPLEKSIHGIRYHCPRCGSRTNWIREKN
jgi:predicted RNA-binding Zn-ribbon protein involved in translation (DUF1610 family)